MHSDPLNLIRIIPVQEDLNSIGELHLFVVSLVFWRVKMITVNGKELNFSGNITELLDILE